MESKTIRIKRSTFERLSQHSLARGFDTPDRLINRILDKHEESLRVIARLMKK